MRIDEKSFPRVRSKLILSEHHFLRLWTKAAYFTIVFKSISLLRTLTVHIEYVLSPIAQSWKGQFSKLKTNRFCISTLNEIHKLYEFFYNLVHECQFKMPPVYLEALIFFHMISPFFYQDFVFLKAKFR